MRSLSTFEKIYLNRGVVSRTPEKKRPRLQSDSPDPYHFISLISGHLLPLALLLGPVLSTIALLRRATPSFEAAMDAVKASRAKSGL